MDVTIIAMAAGAGLILGFLIAKLVEKGKASRTIQNAKKEANRIHKDAHKEGERTK